MPIGFMGVLRRPALLPKRGVPSAAPFFRGNAPVPKNEIDKLSPRRRAQAQAWLNRIADSELQALTRRFKTSKDEIKGSYIWVEVVDLGKNELYRRSLRCTLEEEEPKDSYNALFVKGANELGPQLPIYFQRSTLFGETFWQPTKLGKALYKNLIEVAREIKKLNQAGNVINTLYKVLCQEAARRNLPELPVVDISMLGQR